MLMFRDQILLKQVGESSKQFEEVEIDFHMFGPMWLCRYAGILMGITNTWGTIPGFVSPLVVGALTNDDVSWVGLFDANYFKQHKQLKKRKLVFVIAKIDATQVVQVKKRLKNISVGFRVVSRAGLFGSGLGLKLTKISGLIPA